MKKLISLILTIALVLTAVPMGAFSVTANAADVGNTTEFAGGSGTAEDPYLVSTIEHLYNVRNYMDSHFKMTNDIDLTEATAEGGDWDYGGRGWNPIGSGDTYSADAFSGVFDGNGHSVIGMRINLTSSNATGKTGDFIYVGLFAKVSGTVKNLHIVDTNIEAIYFRSGYRPLAGAIVAHTTSTAIITNCSVSGKVKAGQIYYVGGIVGYNGGEISNCYNESTVSGDTSYYQSYAGGIVGYNYGQISNCYNTGNITSYHTGGIVAYNDGSEAKIKNCYNIGTAEYGIAQHNNGSITNCYYLSTSGKGAGTSLTEAQMKLQSVYSGFDFENVWTMGGDTDYLYPELQCNAGNDNIPTVDKAVNSDGYIEIRTIEDLYAVRNDLTAKYILMNDIDLTEATAEGGDWDYGGRGWNPIGSNDTYDNGEFSGVFDGNGHSIIGMRINLTSSNATGKTGEFIYVGLFAKVSGTVKNLHVVDTDIKATYYTSGRPRAGAIVAHTTSTAIITNCSVSGEVKAGQTYYASGIVGINYGEISNCYNESTVSGDTSYYQSYAGGIVGYNYGQISNCYNTGNITSYHTGGIVAYNDGSEAKIKNCYNIGTAEYGIAQHNNGSITNCYYLSTSGKGAGTSLTEAQMKLQSVYSGFDFETVWTMGGDPEYPYPELQVFTLSGKLGVKGDVAYLSTIEPDLSKINVVDDTFTYEWLVGGEVVATTETYTLQASDIGKKIKLKVTGNKKHNQGTLYSDEITVSKAIQTASVLPSELLSVDDKAIEITTVAEQEYSIDNANWQKNGVFENLDPNKTYFVYSRISENDLYLTGESVKILSVTTDRRPLTGVVNITGTSRYGDTVKADVSGVLPVGATFSYEWKSGDKVVGTGKTYTITKSDIGKNISLSVIGTDNYIGTLTSAPVAATKASVQNPSAPVVSSKTNTSVTLVTKAGYEYSKDKVVWQDSPVFSGLSAATEYTFYQRAKETETTFASVSSSGTKVITLKNTVTAPANPVVEKVTNTTVTLKAIDGYEYSMDGLNWQTSNVFKGLEAYTEYSFCQRIAENKTDYASAQSGYTRAITLKNTVSAPAAPKVEKATETSVTLVDISGYEYSKDGTTWQSNNVFTGLTTLETYTFYQRIKETTSDYASAVSAGTFFKVKYVAGQPDAPVLKEKTNNKIAVEAKSGYEYSINKTSWNTTGIFTGLQPNQTYSVYCRVPETDTHYASAESDGLSVTTLKNTTSKPSAPTVSSKTSTSVTLVQVSGAEYSKDGTTWQKSNVFSGLSPNKTYTFYQRIAETTTTYASEKSAGTTVTTPKNTVSAPSAPTLSSKTATSVTLTAKNGYEYSKNGATWQDSNVFNGLTPNTQYSFYQRVKETDTSYASEKSAALSVTTPKNAVSTPSAPVLRDATATMVVLEKTVGYEYSKDGTTWQDSNMFSGLTANTQYTFYQRVKETNTTQASAISPVFKAKTTEKSVCSIKPASPIVQEYTAYKIVLVAREGYEYKIGNGSWTTNPTFTGLSANTSYTVYQRIAETSDELASEASAGVTVKTASVNAGTTAATNYDKLRNYINTKGNDISGVKTILLTDNSSSGMTIYYYMENISSGIRFGIMTSQSDADRMELWTEFTLTRSSTDISVYSQNLLYYKGSKIDTAYGTRTMNRSTYSTSKTYSFYESGSYITSSGFCDNFNLSMKKMCVYLDSYIYAKLGFGLKALGFTSFSSGLGSTVCDPLASYHTGSTETRNARTATCTIDGYTGDKYCASCGEKRSSGSTISSIGHHEYSDTCDKDCNVCGEERRITHTYTGDCDEKCNICSHNRLSLTEHSFNADGVCTVCGALERMIGDIDADEVVTQDDAVYLLLHTMFGEMFYPLNGAPADFDDDGTVTQEDAVYLLLHTMFGETFYPLKAQIQLFNKEVAK